MMYACNSSFIQVIKLCSLTFIQVNTCRGELIKEGSVIFLNYVIGQYLLLTNVFLGGYLGSIFFLNAYVVLTLLVVTLYRGWTIHA
jgi:hypothetical protein